MKPTILALIRQLGGRTNQVTGQSLHADLQAIAFDSVLYPRPTDTPWASADTAEPVAGLNELIQANRPLLEAGPLAFSQHLAGQLYCLTEAPHGQVFFRNDLFTPFRPGTPDYAEWNDYFTDPAAVDLSAVYAITADKTPDFICLAFSYGFPDSYYVCLSDPQPDNPTVFGTDHEEFFCPVTNHGSLEDFLRRFMPKEEFMERLQQWVLR